jgi:hypothetical protein
MTAAGRSVVRTPGRWRIAAAGALALITIAPVAACGAEPLAPLPVQAAAPEPSATAAAPSAPPSAVPATTAAPPGRVATRAAPGPVRTTKSRTTAPGPADPACYGAVRHDVNLQEEVLDLITSMCFHIGGILRLQGIGPGLVTATPTSLRSYNYEAGVVDLRFLRPGTVTVTIPQEDRTHTITVVVVD